MAPVVEERPEIKSHRVYYAIAGVVFVVILAIVGGVVGGVLGSRNTENKVPTLSPTPPISVTPSPSTLSPTIDNRREQFRERLACLSKTEDFLFETSPQYAA